MAILTVTLVFVANVFFAAPAEYNETSLQHIVQSLVHNVSELRKDMVATDVLQKYLRQEISFRNTVQQNLEELNKNYTALNDLYIQGNVEKQNLQVEFRELRNNYSDLQTQCFEIAKEQELLKNSLKDLRLNYTSLQGAIAGVQYNLSVINILYRDDLQQTGAIKQNQNKIEREVRQISLLLTEAESKSVQLWNSTENIKTTIEETKRDLLLNLSSLESNLLSPNQKTSRCSSSFLISTEPTNQYRTKAKVNCMSRLTSYVNAIIRNEAFLTQRRN